jgi:hypothetical protein
MSNFLQLHFITKLLVSQVLLRVSWQEVVKLREFWLVFRLECFFHLESKMGSFPLSTLTTDAVFYSRSMKTAFPYISIKILYRITYFCFVLVKNFSYALV